MASDEYFGIGSNDLKSYDSFYSRIAYKVYAFEGKYQYSNVRDFWAMESIFYGKIDTLFMPIRLDTDRLVAIPEEDNQFALPFVSNAYVEMKKEIQYGLLCGQVVPSPFLNNIGVKKSTIPSDSSYRGWCDSIIRRAILFFSNSEKLSKIKTFDDFFPIMRNFLKEFSKNNIITRSSYTVSNLVSLSHTGLCLELGSEDASNDFEKINFYIDDPGYSYFLKVAQKYGFYVDKNVPWRIVANLSSEPMRKFIEQAGADSNIQSVLSNFFKNAYSGDLGALYYIFYNTYTQITSRRPRFNNAFVEGGKLFSETVYRTSIENPEEMFENHPEGEWLKLYIDIKNEEKKWDFTEQQTARIHENALDIKKILDTPDAMRYINWVFRDYPAQEGSSNDVFLRKFYKNQSQFGFDDYKKFLAQSSLIKNKR